MIPAGIQNPRQEALFGELDKLSKKFMKMHDKTLA